MSDATRPSNDEPDPKADPKTEELVAYLDGELDPAAAEAVRAKLGIDPKLRAEADSLQKAFDALDFLPRARPSVSFTTKTVSQVIPALSSAMGATSLVPGNSGAAATMPAFTPPAGVSWFWPLTVVLVALSAGVGYFGHMAFTKSDDSKMIKDIGLLNNLKLYRHIDDLDFLMRLDSPELFRDDD
jgi:hypothetical protein